MSDARRLRLEVVLQAVDKATRPLRGLLKTNDDLARSIKATRDRLKQLDTQNANIESWRKFKGELKANSQALADTASKANELQRKLKELNTVPAQKKTLDAQVRAKEKELDWARKNLADQMSLRTHYNPALVDKYASEVSKLTGQLGQLKKESTALSDVEKTSKQKLTKEFEAAVKKTKQLKEEQAQLRTNLSGVRKRMDEAGISTIGLSKHQAALRKSVKDANETLEQQKAQLKAVADRQRRLADAQKAADRMRTHAGTFAAAGAGASVAGAATAAPIWKGLGESKHYELEKTRMGALGLGDSATKESIEFAKQMKAYGVSQVDKAELVRDALSTFADAHHAEMVLPTLAKMKFANKAVFGQAQGADNERMFMDLLKVIELRGGLASEEEFRKQADMVQRVITATGGRVQADEWLNVIKRGGLAAKGVDSEAFFYTLEPLVQEMGGNTVGTAMMSAYQNLYQGKTTKRTLGNLDRFGLIADRSKVKEDKAGQVSFMDPGALKGADIFRKDQFAWLEQVLLPTLKEKGITEKDQVLDAIGSIFSNRTASGLMSQMYLQRDQIHKNMRLNKGAAGIEQLDTAAKGLPQGKELETLAKVHDLQKEIGEKVMPLYARALEWVAKAADRVTKFMQENPGVAKAMAVGVGVLAATLLTIGPILLTIASVLWPLAKLRTIMAALTGGAKGGSIVMRLFAGAFNLLMRCAGGLSNRLVKLGTLLRPLVGILLDWAYKGAMLFGKGIGLITRVVLFLGKAFGFVLRCVGVVGKVLLWVGRLALANPLLAVIALIAAGALYIWQNWETIGPELAALWQGIKDAFGRAWDWIKEKASGIADWFNSTKDKLLDAGRAMVDGLLSGISERWAALKQKVSELADGVATWFKEKLGIHSPSRVFATLGGFTMAGLTQGLEDGQDAPLKAVQTLATKLTGIGAGIVIGSTAAVAAPISFDTRPALTTSAVAAAPAAAAAPITIHIHPPAGADPHAIARLVRDELRQIENQRAARQRSRLADRDQP
ncbi:phage tail protein [Ralstonia pickettii]|uniref:phage tail protein n=1 Tax=Ralstonia pickettii TaxID=329 RepID=UPI0015BDDA00|nr:phage tail protein [Ralstonia pickettii]NWK44888.1 phage tail protein [Ralstonia pickettii]